MLDNEDFIWGETHEVEIVDDPDSVDAYSNPEIHRDRCHSIDYLTASDLLPQAPPALSHAQ